MALPPFVWNSCHGNLWLPVSRVEPTRVLSKFLGGSMVRSNETELTKTNYHNYIIIMLYSNFNVFMSQTSPPCNWRCTTLYFCSSSKTGQCLTDTTGANSQSTVITDASLCFLFTSTRLNLPTYHGTAIVATATWHHQYVT